MRFDTRLRAEERGLAQPRHFARASVNGMPHPWRFHGWAAMPMGSGDFADVKLRFSSLIDQNRTIIPASRGWPILSRSLRKGGTAGTGTVQKFPQPPCDI
jgi:hypothetical protein